MVGAPRHRQAGNGTAPVPTARAAVERARGLPRTGWERESAQAKAPGLAALPVRSGCGWAAAMPGSSPGRLRFPGRVAPRPPDGRGPPRPRPGPNDKRRSRRAGHFRGRIRLRQWSGPDGTGPPPRQNGSGWRKAHQARPWNVPDNRPRGRTVPPASGPPDNGPRPRRDCPAYGRGPPGPLPPASGPVRFAPAPPPAQAPSPPTEPRRTETQ